MTRTEKRDRRAEVTIGLFSLRDHSDVIGATEPYYVSEYLATRRVLYAVVPSGGRRAVSGKVAYDVLRVPRLFGLPPYVSFNLLAPLRSFHRLLRTDLIYTYKGVFTPALLAKWILRRRWACDFRSSPVAQDLEFRMVTHRLTWWRRLVYRLEKTLYRVILRGCDLVVAISPGVAEELVNHYHVSIDRVFVLPVGVDLDRFRAIPYEEIASPEQLTMCYVGALAKHRGLETVLEALSRVSAEVPARLILAGDGPEEDVRALKQEAARLGLDDRVVWRGYIPHEQIPGLLSEAMISVSPLPDLQAYRVSVPAKVVESMAAGAVVIASDIPAHQRLLTDGVEGLLFPPGDAIRLAELALRVYRDSNLRLKLQRAAQDGVQEYAWDRLLDGLDQKLQELVP